MIWLIGSGGMAIDYAKVLLAQKQEVITVGRGEESAANFEAKTDLNVITGGIVNFLNLKPELPNAAIVSVGVEQLYSTTLSLLEYGVKRILVEKPGGLLNEEMANLKVLSEEYGAQVYIAYNRRFYSSVMKAQALIELDGGVTSFNFELTEWSHVIEKLNKTSTTLAKWFLGNSTHVADLAFFLGGKPKDISTYTAGGLDWHPSSAVFSGAGVSETGALFNYGADWESAGRWSVEVLTNQHRYILRPMESLQIQKRGSINCEFVDINDELDKQFKPGLYLQVDAFLNNKTESLCSLEEQNLLFSVYEKMAGY